MIRPLTHARLASLLAALSSIGPFAIDEGLVATTDPVTTVRIASSMIEA